MLEIKKREGESVGSFMYRFNKRVKQSGILMEIKRRQFRDREENRRARRNGALYRKKKHDEHSRMKKY